MARTEKRNVRVKYVNAPKKEGGKYGNIKVDGDELIWVPVDQLRMFQQGVSYEIEVKQQKWGNDWVDVLDKIIYGSGDRVYGSSAQASAPAQSYDRDKQRATGGRAMSSSTDMHIFITGIVGRAMGSGKFGPGDVNAWTKAAIDAFFKGQVYIAKLQEDLAADGEEPPPPQPEQRRDSGPKQDFSRDPDDEIPF